MTDIGIPIKAEYTGTDPVGFREISIAGKAGHILKVNDTETSFEYMTIDSPKRTLLLSGAGGWDSTTDGANGITQIETTVNLVNLKVASFLAGASDTHKEYAIAMPKNWDGDTITFTPYFLTEGVQTSGTIIFGLQARSFASTDDLDQAYGTAQEVLYTITEDSSYKLLVGSESSAITVAGTPSGGNFTQFKIYRKGSDTFAGDVGLLGVMISYGTNNYSDE